MDDIKLMDFNLPELPDSFSKGFDILKEYGESAIEKTTEAVSGVGDKLRDKLKSSLRRKSETTSDDEGDNSNKPVDFNSIGSVGDVISFGGIIPLPGSYTTSYKTPCKPGQYDAEVEDYLESVREDQDDLSRFFTDIGGFFNFDRERENGIFIRKNVKVNCAPQPPKKQGRKSRKLGESCVDDRECIPSDNRNNAYCKKKMRDKYLSGVCDEIIRGENKKCKDDDDCASDLLQCVNKKCISRKRRAVSQNNTKKGVNTNIPLESFTGLGR